jgi:hypothetical protein
MTGKKENFNIFKMLDIEKKENYHSQFIISVINSSDDAMKLFLKMLKGVVNGEAVIDESVKYKVIPEKTLKGTTNEIESDKKNGRVDIFLSDTYGKEKGDKNRILIENKIYAGEQKGQIKRYYKQYWEDKKTGYKGALFYLTLEKKPATDYSAVDLGGGSHYFLLGYEEDIAKWLKDVLSALAIDKSNIRLMLYIQDYLEIINNLTNEIREFNRKYKIDEPVNSLQEKIFLELKFWNYLEKALQQNKNIDILHNDRKYNYDKILQNHKGLGIKKKTFNYGIIFEDKSGNHFRIGVEVDKIKDQFKLFISKGKFDNSKWEGDPIPLDNCNTNELKKRSNMEKIADEILKKLNQKYDLRIKI